jgi:hypothetical protein
MVEDSRQNIKTAASKFAKSLPTAVLFVSLSFLATE